MDAMGISIHTGWAACVVVGGSLKAPEIVANEIVRVLGDAERFCFHAAAEMTPPRARAWIAQMRTKALANAKHALSAPEMRMAGACAIVAGEGDIGDLDRALSSHMRIHRAEALFYRDVFRDACRVSARIVPASSLDPSKVGKLAPAPWGRDQKLAALAAWSALG